MRVNRVFAIVVPALLVFVGIGLAFDHRFIPRATLSNSPLFVALVYCPTVFFAVITLLIFRRGRLWPLTAFAIGLIGTGLFHQSVLAETYGNPGYMVPIGHLGAPIVSMAAYTASFLGVWAVVRTLRRNAGDDKNENAERPQELK